MEVGIIGAGHVGLPTAASIAHLGHGVVAADSDAGKIQSLSEGRVPFFEPGLEELVRDGLHSGRLTFVGGTDEIASRAEVVFVCVGTPPRASGEANLLAIERALADLAEKAVRAQRRSLVVVEKSTVPAGTAERAAETLRRHGDDLVFHVVSNPEFLREGRAVEDSLRPSRVLVGSDSPAGLQAMRDLYLPLTERGVPLIETDLRTAELAKHACNAFLALKVSFANAMARMCELAGADVTAVEEVMGSDPRIGAAHLKAGLGYGGYCFPKDIAAFEALAKRLGYDFPLLEEIARLNEEAVDAAFAKVEQALWNLEEKRVVLLGLAFKPNTDDIRFAPALSLARRLLDAGSHVVGFDPQANRSVRADMPEVEVVDDVYDALDGAHCAVLCTEWDDFLALDLEKAAEVMSYPILVDGRNLFDPAVATEAGFTYVPTGRPPAKP